jgi:RNA-binding motif protein, X-linked 2
MNAIRQTQLLNKRELENATPPSASWHVDYRDTAWIYVGGLPLDLSEGDVVTIFSQFGNPTHINLIRDKETGKTKGFGFLKYEDQRSCDLAVDNLGGADVLGRLLRVDHTRYKRKEGEDEDTYRIDRLEAEAAAENGNGKRASETEEEGSEDERRGKRRKKMLKEEQELEEMLAITQDGKDQDPMREYLIKEKREEVERARAKEEQRHKHKHRRHHHRRRDEGVEDRERRHHHSHRNKDRSPDEDGEEDRQREKHRRDRDDERRRTGRDQEESDQDRRRSRSGSRDHTRRERRRPRGSGSPSDDYRLSRKNRS